MDTKELVEFVNNVKKDYKFGTEYLNKKGIKIDNYDKLFDLLAIAVVRCVKHEKMWEEFIYGLAHINIGSYQNPFDKKKTDLECVNKIVKDVEQKYFPKTQKVTQE